MLQREPKAEFKNSSFQFCFFFLLLKCLDIGSCQRVDKECRPGPVEREVFLNTVLLVRELWALHFALRSPPSPDKGSSFF